MVMRTIVAALTALMLFATPVVAGGPPPPVVDGNILPKVAQTRCGCG